MCTRYVCDGMIVPIANTWSNVVPRKTTRFTNYTFPAKPFEESDLKKLDEISSKHELEEKICPQTQELLPFEEHLRLIAERHRESVATEFATFEDNKRFLAKIKRRSSNLVKGLNELPPEAKKGWVLSRIKSLEKTERWDELSENIGRIETEIKKLQDEIDKIKRYQRTVITTNKRIKAIWRCWVATDVYEVFETFGLQPKLHDDSIYYLCIRIVLSHAGGRLGNESVKSYFSNCRRLTNDKKFHIPKPRVPSPK